MSAIRSKRLIAATRAVQAWLDEQKRAWPRRRRAMRCTDVLGVIEVVRHGKDREWWYVAIVKTSPKEWELIRLWAEHGRWTIQDRGNALSWNDAVVEAMALATRLTT